MMNSFKYLFLLLATFALGMLSCSSQSPNEEASKKLEGRLEELEKQNKELKHQIELQQDEVVSDPSKNISLTKYAFVVIQTQEPALEYIPIRGRSAEDGIFNVTWNNYIYTTEIAEISNYDENKKYKLMDEASQAVRKKFIYKEMQFLSSMPHTNIGDVNKHEQKRQDLAENKCEIVDRKCFVFDSYREASLSREDY